MAEEDPRKIRSDLNKSANDLTEEIDKAKSGLRPQFAEMIDNIKKTNAPLAKSVAELRKTSKDTFAGALSASKLTELTAVVEKYVSEGQDALDVNELESLKRNFITASGEAFDFEAFRETSNKIDQTTQEYKDILDKEAELNDARSERLAIAEKSNNTLGKLDTKINNLKERQLLASGNALNEITKQIAEEESAREQAKNRILAAYDRQIEDVQEQRKKIKEQLDEEEDVRTEFNDSLRDVLGDAVSFDGLESFSDSLKELTGFDLVGNLNTMVTKINAIGGLFGKEDLFGSLMDGVKSLPGLAASFGSAVVETASLVAKDLADFGSAAIDGLMSVAKGFASTIQEMALFVGNAFMTAGRKIFTLVSTMFGGFIGIMKTVGTFLMAGATTMLVAVKGMLLAAGTFVLGLLSAAGGLLLAALPMIAIGAAIGLAAFAIFKAGEYLYENSEGFREFIDNAWMKIKEVGETILTAAQDLWTNITEIWDGLTESITEFMANPMSIVDDLKEMVASLWESIKAPIKTLTNFFLGEEDPAVEEAEKAEEVQKQKRERALESAKESGLYDSNFFGASTVDFDKAKTASDEQLQAILDDKDLDAETQKKVEALLNDPKQRMERAQAKRQEILDQVESTGEKNFAAAESTGEENFATVESTRERNFATVESTRENRTAAKVMLDGLKDAGNVDVVDLTMERQAGNVMSSTDRFVQPTSAVDIKESRQEAEDISQQQSSKVSMNNVVGGTTVNNMNTTKFLGTPKIKDNDSSLSRVNRTENW